jgi:hypothetical protein
MIPASARPLDQMRCPLCQTQFLVQDVLATSILAPPEAIPVSLAPADIAAAVGPRLSRTEEPVAWEPEPIRVVATRPRKKQPGVFSHLVGIIGGGLIGLSLGYLGLLRFGGPRYDFLEIADKLPDWVFTPIPAIPLPQFNRGNGDEPQRNDRQLKDLLDAPEQPPAVEVPAADISPFDAVGAPATQEPPPPPPHMPEATEPPPGAPPDQSPSPFGDGPSGPGQQQAHVGPRHFTAYSVEDLAAAVADAGAVLGCPHCNATGYVTRTVMVGTREVKGEKVPQTAERSVACEVCGGKPVAKMTPEVYARLCHLAEVVTFVSKGESTAWQQREAVQKLLMAAGADQKAAESIGRLAGFQLDHARHKEPGIALAGTVQEMSQVGSLYGMKIVLFGLPKVVTVISWRPAQPAIREHDRVLILGTIVDNPAENLVGYDGRLPQVVWGGLPAKLPPQP